MTTSAKFWFMFSASLGYAVENVHGLAVGLAITTGFCAIVDLIDTLNNCIKGKV